MNNMRLISKTGEPDENDKKVMVKGMLAYHASSGHPRNVEHHTILLKDETGKLFGMVIATFLYNGMEIQTLWVEETVRDQGWGGKLMKAAEAVAVKRGCSISYTNTFSWQAPLFYEKMGYKLYGKLENFPEGNALSYYVKKLY